MFSTSTNSAGMIIWVLAPINMYRKSTGDIIKIYHESVDGIEKSVPRIDVWHHEACRVMTNDDPEGRIFLSRPHTNNRIFFLFISNFAFLFFYKLREVPDYDEMRHNMATSDQRLSLGILSLGKLITQIAAC